jgi:hypothetical protein
MSQMYQFIEVPLNLLDRSSRHKYFINYAYHKVKKTWIKSPWKTKFYLW